MSLKSILGLNKAGISDMEIMKKIAEAQTKNLDEVEFVTKDGSVIKVSLPHVHFDPNMDLDSW